MAVLECMRSLLVAAVVTGRLPAVWARMEDRSMRARDGSLFLNLRMDMAASTEITLPCNGWGEGHSKEGRGCTARKGALMQLME